MIIQKGTGYITLKNIIDMMRWKLENISFIKYLF